MKFTAIIGVGSCYYVWFPYTIASIYNAVDEIVVVNGGIDINSSESPTEFNIPLKEVTRDIQKLDIDGKIIEIKGFTVNDVHTKLPFFEGPNKLRGKEYQDKCYDCMGFNATLAHETAIKKGADLILSVDADHVCYPEVEHVRNAGPVVFQAYEFLLDEDHLCYPRLEHEAYHGGAFTYYPKMGEYFTFFKCRNDLTCNIVPSNYRNAHYRWAAPSWFSQDELFEYFYHKNIYHIWTNYEYSRIPWGSQLKRKAREVAQQFLKGDFSYWFVTPRTPKITEVKSPPALTMKPIDYIMESRRK